MRSFFSQKNSKTVKILYRVLTAFLVVCWILMAMSAIGWCAIKKYVYPLEYKETVFYYADHYGLERGLIFSVIKTESSFDKSAVSGKGAMGLMQITAKTGEYIAQKLGLENYDLLDAEDNVNLGCFYLKYLYLRFKDMDTALVAYNAGEGNVALWLSEKSLSDDQKTLKIIPFAESREYLKKIQQNFTKYKKLYGNILDKQ